MKLLLLSNSTDYGRRPLEHAASAVGGFLGEGTTVTFLPLARPDWVTYSQEVAETFEYLGIPLVCADTVSRIGAMVGQAQALYIGGGNTFRLLRALYEYDLVDVIRQRVLEGVPYLGDSAGSIVPCPTIRTSNDMPVVEPPTLEALNLIPFQINPHYIEGKHTPTHMGETRDERLGHYLEDNDAPVVALREGSWLRVSDKQVALGGLTGGRLFRREHAADELHPGHDLSELLAGGTTERAEEAEVHHSPT